MNALWIEILKVIGAALGFGSAAFLTYKVLREKKLSDEAGLPDNPERCGQHQAKIERLREDLDALKSENANAHRDIFMELHELRLELVKIGVDIEKPR